MAVNTLNDLTTLLAHVEYDVQVLASIVNDAANTTVSDFQGPVPGTVITRSGFVVKNLQRAILDIEEFNTNARPIIQEEGATIVSSPEIINFVGTTVSVTDVAGVATITIAEPQVTKAGAVSGNQIAVWASNGVLNGSNNFRWGGTILNVAAVSPIIELQDTVSGNVSEILSNGSSLVLIADNANLVPASSIQFEIDGAPTVTMQSSGNVLINGGHLIATQHINTQNGVSYTLLDTDRNAIIVMTEANPNTVTIDISSSTAYQIGSVIEIHQVGVGVTTIESVGGVTLNGIAAGSGAISAQYGSAYLRKINTDVWTVNGDIGAIS